MPKRRLPVEWWALVAALFVVFWAYVLIRWVAGPYFEQVDGGANELPTYMKISTITWQAAAIPVVGVMLYFWLVKPWRRERVVATPTRPARIAGASSATRAHKTKGRAAALGQPDLAKSEVRAVSPALLGGAVTRSLARQSARRG